MEKYEVKYKRLGLFSRWKKIKRVKGDGLIENNICRYFITDEEIRIEIPVTNHIFKFSKGRFYTIKNQLQKKADQTIPVDKG